MINSFRFQLDNYACVDHKCGWTHAINVTDPAVYIITSHLTSNRQVLSSQIMSCWLSWCSLTVVMSKSQVMPSDVISNVVLRLTGGHVKVSSHAKSCHLKCRATAHQCSCQSLKSCKVMSPQMSCHGSPVLELRTFWWVLRVSSSAWADNSLN